MCLRGEVGDFVVDTASWMEGIVVGWCARVEEDEDGNMVAESGCGFGGLKVRGYRFVEL